MEQENRYRQILDDQTDPVCRFLVDGTLTFVNRAYAHYFHKKEKELIGHSFFENMPEEHTVVIQTRVGSLSPEEPVFKYEHEAQSASAELRWINWTFRGIFNGQGQMVEIQSVARDVTDRKRAEIGLKKSEERYLNLIKAIPDGVVAYNPEGKATYVNDGFIDLYGWSHEEVLGRPLNGFVPPEEEQKTLEAWQKTFTGEKVLLETKRVTKDGRPLDIQLRTAILLDRDGLVSESIVIHRDITERKKAQEVLQRAHDQLEQRVTERTAELAETHQRFRAVFETAGDLIFLKDRDLFFTHVNPAFLKTLEIQESQVIGKKGEELFERKEADYINDLEYRTLAGQVVEATYNLTIGNLFKTLHCIRVPLRNAMGETIGLCGIARDITDRKALELRCPTALTQTRSRLMETTLEQARLAAQSESIVLLLGESGSGKDYLAKYLHEHSRRSGGPFFAINCAALAASIAESELFGHEPGAFSGTRGRKRGLLEMAEGGTLLLNEIGELSLELQAKLLTFLDIQSFTRVGGEKMIRVNARIVGATNRDLEQDVAEGRFRKDLYYRLNVFSIRIPSLRERVEDIPFLSKDILRSLSLKMGKPGPPPDLDGSALKALVEYTWPGNIRELRNILERTLILCQENIITADDLAIPEKKGEESAPETTFSISVNLSDQCGIKDAVGMAKRQAILKALNQCRGNVSAAARVLGVSRDALRHYMKMLNVARTTLRSSK
jgi:PAS domain S-box-containing protein